MGFKEEVSLGVKVFMRSEKLYRLLESVEDTEISKVYIADGGNTEDRIHMYEKSWNFELELIDLEFNCGLGAGRKAIAEKVEEKYLLVVDSDNEIPKNIQILYDILEKKPRLGGVCGLFFETQNDLISHRLRAKCKDITINGSTIKYHRNDKETQWVSGHPIIKFDFIENIAIIRRECIDDHVWDEDLEQGWAHDDFYLGHKNTKWEFAMCPEVLFPHNRADEKEGYKNNRRDTRRLERSKKHFMNKWGIKEVETLNTNYIDTVHPDFGSFRPINLKQRILRIKNEEGYIPLIKKGLRKLR